MFAASVFHNPIRVKRHYPITQHSSTPTTYLPMLTSDTTKQLQLHSPRTPIMAACRTSRPKQCHSVT